MPEMGALFIATQAMAAPGELLNLSLNASAVLPEAAVLLAMIATLLVDLAGEKTAARWVPPICYAGLGSALLLLALQWNAPLEPSFLGAFLADNLAVAFRSVIALSTLLRLSKRQARRIGISYFKEERTQNYGRETHRSFGIKNRKRMVSTAAALRSDPPAHRRSTLRITRMQR